MRLVDQDVLELWREQRLLEDVLHLVQEWDGRPPGPLLDAVLSGDRRPGGVDGYGALPLQRRRRS